jgi:integrase
LQRADAGALAGLPLAELVPLYIEQVQATYRGKDEHYASRKATDLSEYIAAHWTQASEVTADSWKSVMLKLHHKNGGPLRWRSIAHAALTLRAFLAWCQGKHIIEEVPAIEVPSAKDQGMDRSDRRAFTEEEMESFLWALAILGERRALRIYTVLFETWQRKSTVEALTPRWLNFHKETITIPAQHFKTGKQKVIDLNPRAAEALRAEMAEKSNIALDEPLFGPFNFHQAAVRRKKEDGGIFGRACRLAGIDPHGLTPHHVTRHTAATLALENGTSILGAMAQGGWDSRMLDFGRRGVRCVKHESRKLPYVSSSPISIA